MLIIIAQQGRRFTAKVASELADKDGYCATKRCYGSLYSTAVPKIRQPIELLNAWIEEKVHIQMASKVRSYAGLMVHIFGNTTIYCLVPVPME